MLKYVQVAVVVSLLVGGTAVAQDTSAWTLENDPSNELAVTAGAAMATTSFGLAATPNGGSPPPEAFVEDQTPATEPRYRARFYFKTNTLDPGNALGKNRTRIFTAISVPPNNPEGGNRRMIMIALRRLTSGGEYTILARVFRGLSFVNPSDGTKYDITPFIDVGDENSEHFVEIDWQRESSPGANNGSFTMWLDTPPTGTPVATFTGIGLNSYGVDSARLGLIQPLNGANGTVFLDEFESRRLNDIGPIL
jgi:hypothetical protein